MKQSIVQAVDEAIAVSKTLQDPSALHFIEQAALLIGKTFEKGGKLLIGGNGGSLCDATHFAEELTGVFRKKRAALPAIALSCPGHLTCVANDLGFEEVFARGVEAYGKEGDLFVALTTSGNSNNLLNAALEAKKKGLGVITFLGKGGGALKGKGDLEWIVPSQFITSDRIQEAHMAAIHILIEMVEKYLFYA